MISKLELNFSREDFLESTFKEITELLIHLNALKEESENYVEENVNIEDVPFL